MSAGHANDVSHDVRISPYDRAHDDGAGAAVTPDPPDDDVDASVDGIRASNDTAVAHPPRAHDDGETTLQTETDCTLLPAQSHTAKNQADCNPLATLKARLYDLKWHVPRCETDSRTCTVSHQNELELEENNRQKVVWETSVLCLLPLCLCSILEPKC